MFIDLHLHEKRGSDDSHQWLEDMVREARRVGLDAICITDHDTMKSRSFIEAYSKRIGFPIFVGVEYFSLDGDLLAFGIDELPEGRISAQAFVDYVNARGGATIAAHPFRSNRRGLEAALLMVHGLSAVEVRNGSTTDEANALAKTAAKLRHLPMTGASDAHVLDQVGVYATEFPDETRTLSDLVRALKQGLIRPVVWTERGYCTTVEKLKEVS